MSDVSTAISLPFSFNSNGSLTTTSDPKKICQDRVVIAVMTAYGERVMRPNFGSGAKSAVFEPEDVAKSLINQAVTTAFGMWLKPLTLTKVTYHLDNAEQHYFNVFYTYAGDTISESVTIKTAILSRAGETLLEVPR